MDPIDEALFRALEEYAEPPKAQATGECPTCGTPYPAYFKAVRRLLLAVHRGELYDNPDSYWETWWIVEEMTRAMEKEYDQA